MNIGEKIESLVAKKRISAPEMAKSLGMTKANIYNIFSRKSLDTELLIKISDFLDVSPTIFFTQEDSQESDSQKILNESSTEVIHLYKSQIEQLQEQNIFLRKQLEIKDAQLEKRDALLEK